MSLQPSPATPLSSAQDAPSPSRHTPSHKTTSGAPAPSGRKADGGLLRFPRKIARRILGRDQRQAEPAQDPNIYPLF